MSTKTRADLTMTAYAIAHGFSLCGSNLKPLTPADFVGGIPGDFWFRRGAVNVWQTARGWRVAELIGGTFTPPQDGDFYARLLPALDAAIARPASPVASTPEARAEQRINGNDGTADKAGAMLAEALHLRRDPEHRDRWRTTWGTKTNAGLARTVLRMLLDESAGR